MSIDNSVNFSKEQHWNPDDVIAGHFGKNKEKYTCIILNRPIGIPQDIVEKLWENAQIRCTVDGGTNRWKNFVTNHYQGKTMKLPDYITGDFDSITADTWQFFNYPEIQIIHTPDQNSTDFKKAIEVLKPIMKEKQIQNIIVFHDTSGRIDHIMSNINTLFTSQSHNLNLFIMTGNSLSWLLLPGLHTIHISNDLIENKRWCSLIPVGNKVSITTNGLKWNLNQDILEFGGMVSSSNTYSSNIVQIKVDNCILWAMGILTFTED